MAHSAIEWCDVSWNPVTGCRHGCPYCYAQKIARRFCGNVKANKLLAGEPQEGNHYLKDPVRGEDGKIIIYPFAFEPTFHEYRLNEIDKYKGGKNIFVGSMADMFGSWVPEEWILEVFRKAKEVPKHNYIFLTKNPDRLCELANKDLLPKGSNFWYGTTITRKRHRRFEGGLSYNTFVSIEPVMEDLDMGIGSLGSCKWVIIGAETGARKEKVVPDKRWIDNILDAASITQVPVFMKDSLLPIKGELNMRREFPQELLEHELGDKAAKRLMARCRICKETYPKKEMYAIISKRRQGTTLFHLCDSCYQSFMDWSDEDNLPRF